MLNLLASNDDYSGRTAPLTSKCCILYIFSTNIGTEYFKHGIYSPFFPLQNAVCFIILTYLFPVLFAFYIQSVLKLKKNNSSAKRSYMCRGSSVSMVSRLRAERPRNVDSCSGEGRLYSTHSDSVLHPAPHPIGPRGSFPVLNIAEYLITKFNQVPRLRIHHPVYLLSHTSSCYGAKLNISVEGSLAVNFSNNWFYWGSDWGPFLQFRHGVECVAVFSGDQIWICVCIVCRRKQQDCISFTAVLYTFATWNLCNSYSKHTAPSWRRQSDYFCSGKKSLFITSRTKYIMLWRLICNFSIRQVEHITWAFGNDLDSAHLQQFCYLLAEY